MISAFQSQILFSKGAFMFHKFHIQMTAFACLVTGSIVVFMTCICLMISQRSLKENCYQTFSNNAASCIFHLESQSLLSHQWLLQAKNTYGVEIEILDNGKPLYFEKLNPSVDDKAAFEKAAEIAKTTYGMDLHTPGNLSITKSAIFQMKDYYACTALIPKKRSSISMCLLYPLDFLKAQQRKQFFSFWTAAAAAILALAGFSWLFTGKLIRPLEKSRQKQTEFIAAASHELRSPLTVIQSNMQAMEKATPKESERFHQIIQKEVGRMSRLIGDMLAVANADSRSWNMLFAPCELDTLLLDTYEKYEPLMQEKGLSLNVSLPDDALPPCTCDASRISQTLGILLDNAISYVPPKGRVELTLSFDTRHFYLSVSDNGPGIADEKKEAVFQRFYRGDSSRTDKEHFGLGLSIASEILRFHKGSLKVTDTPGGGSTFLLSLPR